MLTLPRRTGRTLIILFALVLLVALCLGNTPAPAGVALADARLGATPSPKDRTVQPPNAATSATPAAQGSKNDTTQPAYDPNGVTHSGPAAPGTKNYDGPTTDDISTQATSATGWRFVACGAASDSSWTTTSASFQTIRSCTLNVPEDGFVFIDATTSVGLSNTGFEVRFNLGIDSAAGNSATDRWVNVYTDSGDGTDKSAAVTLLAPVSAGPHTFYFLGARYAGSGTVQLYDPSLSVLYFPGSSADVLACGAASNLTWTTTATSFQTIRSCSLTLPQSGFAYISGTSSVGLSNTAFEGQFRVGVDSVSGTASSDRWVNVYPDSGDGTDESVATSLLTSVSAGAHTFYFSGRRYTGTGTVQLYDPSLSVLYFPAPNVTAKVCGAAGSDSWTNNTTSYTIIRSCTLNVPRDGFAFLDANGSAGLNTVGAGNEWEGQFRLGVDSVIGSSVFDRWVNVYNDASPGDGTDRTVADSGLVNVSSGVHTFYFVGRRYAGTGTLRLYSPSLTVVTPGAALFMPLMRK